MARKSIIISEEVAKTIKNRRIELGLTIENAARGAGVSIKTWSRYESGEAISEEKLKGVCNVLKWTKLPDLDDDGDDYRNIVLSFDIEYYKNHKYWSTYIENVYGETAATSFVMGAEILFDLIDMDMEELRRKPKGSHIGQINGSSLVMYMPEQFVPEYDYDFLFHMRANLYRLCESAEAGHEVITHSVMDELLLMLMMDVSACIFEEETDDDEWNEWIFDLMDDSDTEFFLYSNRYLEEGNQFHFTNWFKDIFWMN